MQSNASMMSSNPFGMQSEGKFGQSALNSTGITSSNVSQSRNKSNNNLNWRKPLEDFGLREAYETSMFGGSLPRTAPGGRRRAKTGF